MKTLICHLMAAVVLLGALSWAADGHAVSVDNHVPEISDSFTPEHPEPDRNCDHHCHSTSHFLGLAVPEAIIGQDGLDTAPMFRSSLHLSHIQTPPGRPPEA